MNSSSRAGLPLIKSSEGFRSKAYLDSVGIPTIGYGETQGVHLGQTTTEPEALIRLIKRYDGFEADVRKLVKVPLTANQLGALTCFVYNVGSGALAGSTLLRLLNKGDYKGAAAQFAVWNKAGGKTLAGLVTRRAAEAALFLS